MPDRLQDQWISKHSPISPKKMHAIGCIVYYWNLCEADAKGFLWLALGGTHQASMIICHDMGDRAIWEKIILLVKLKKFRPEFIDRLEYGCKIYDRCNTNRNAFVHFLPGSSREPSDDESVLRLARQKGPVFQPIQLHDQLATIRRVADDCYHLHRYLDDLWLNDLDYRYKDRHKDDNGNFPLPDKPPLPELVWTTPDQNQPKRKRRPRSSQA